MTGQTRPSDRARARALAPTRQAHLKVKLESVPTCLSRVFLRRVGVIMLHDVKLAFFGVIT